MQYSLSSTAMDEPTPADNTDSIVKEVLDDLSLKGKSIISYMDENDVSILEAILERYVEGRGDWRSRRLR